MDRACFCIVKAGKENQKCSSFSRRENNALKTFTKMRFFALSVGSKSESQSSTVLETLPTVCSFDCRNARISNSLLYIYIFLAFNCCLSWAIFSIFLENKLFPLFLVTYFSHLFLSIGALRQVHSFARFSHLVRGSRVQQSRPQMWKNDETPVGSDCGCSEVFKT